jgi:hypothetical protein
MSYKFTSKKATMSIKMNRTLFLFGGIMMGSIGYWAFENFVKVVTPFTIFSTRSEEVPVATLDTYVRNYRTAIAGRSGTFAFNVDTTDINELLRQPGCTRIRIYLGLRNAADKTTGVTILTGVDSNNRDIYLLRLNDQGQGVAKGIDECTPCPQDCPLTESNKPMLGRGNP